MTALKLDGETLCTGSEEACLALLQALRDEFPQHAENLAVEPLTESKEAL